MNYEERFRLLEEQVMRLTRENKSLSAIWVKKVKPVVDAFYEYNESEKQEDRNGVAYHG